MRTRTIGYGPFRAKVTVLERGDLSEEELAVARFLCEHYNEVGDLEDYYDDARELMRLVEGRD